MPIGVAIVVPALAWIGGAGGCSSSSASSGPVTFACASYDPTGDAACKSCIQSSSSCAADAVNAFGADWATNLAGGVCKDTATCLAGCACGNDSCAQGCLNGGGMTCLDADHALYTCLMGACASPCGTAPASSDAGFDTSAPLVDSAAAETGNTTDSGQGDVQTGPGPDASTVPVACNQLPVDHYCIIRVVAASAAATTQDMCTQQGGTVDTTCPTANLVGCCTTASTKECYYPPTYNSSNASGGCTLAGGTWSTTE